LYNQPKKQLKDILKADIFVALKMCEILNKRDIMEKLCILLVKTEYMDYWELIDEFNSLCCAIML
jgi:hypothetical protein